MLKMKSVAGCCICKGLSVQRTLKRMRCYFLFISLSLRMESFLCRVSGVLEKWELKIFSFKKESSNINIGCCMVSVLKLIL